MWELQGCRGPCAWEGSAPAAAVGPTRRLSDAGKKLAAVSDRQQPWWSSGPGPAALGGVHTQAQLFQVIVNRPVSKYKRRKPGTSSAQEGTAGPAAPHAAGTVSLGSSPRDAGTCPCAVGPGPDLRCFPGLCVSLRLRLGRARSRCGDQGWPGLPAGDPRHRSGWKSCGRAHLPPGG